MNKLLLFAGTTEGRILAEYLDRLSLSCIVCVATEYGEALLEEGTTRHRILAGRLTGEQMEELMRREGITHVVDATHPYASVVTENIRQAASAAGACCLRLLRAPCGEEGQDLIWVDSVDQAVRYLSDKEGIILAATGSKELAKYTVIPDYLSRVCARILSTRESMEAACGLGFAGKNLICMQGPFDEELNTAMLRQIGASWMVTKESGIAGGFPEKVRAAERAGVRLVVVGRPAKEEGFSQEEIRRRICADFGLSPRRHIALVGIGMGSAEGMTLEARRSCEEADVLIGASRMLETVKDLDKPRYVSYLAPEIRAYVDSHPEYERIAVLLSGDTGFYSGAKKLEEIFAKEELRVFCGISSVAYLCARVHRSWEDVKLTSLHGREQNLVACVRENPKVFALVGRQESFRQLCAQLTAYGLGAVRVHAGCSLSYPDERILTGRADQLLEAETGDLTAVLIENPGAFRLATHGIEDEAFLRDKVPMTKAEVRSVSLSRLRLGEDSVAYDVGAGTGSVSVEMALRAWAGRVYAVEKKREAAELIRQNAARFGTANLEVREGLAPEALETLPPPTHAFIGGSSGSLGEILTLLLAKNPRVRVVINAIALETVNEAMRCLGQLKVEDVDISCVTVSKAKKAGPYHMMMGLNPVYIISFTGAAGEKEER